MSYYKNISDKKLKKDWQDDWERIKKYKNTDRTHSGEVKFISNHVDKIEIFLDCGPGNVGSEAWSIKKEHPECKIIGIEPQKERYEILKKEQYPGELHNSAIGDVCIRKKGYTGYAGGKTDFWAKAGKDLLERNAYKEIEINYITIDSLILNDYENVFVWADIEGSEFAMLKGAIQSMQKGKISGFFLEIHKTTSPDFVEGQGSFKDIETILSHYGYTKKIKYSDKGTHADWLFLREVKK